MTTALPVRRPAVLAAAGLACAGLLAGTLLALTVRPAAPPPPDRVQPSGPAGAYRA